MEAPQQPTTTGVPQPQPQPHYSQRRGQAVASKRRQQLVLSRSLSRKFVKTLSAKLMTASTPTESSPPQPKATATAETAVTAAAAVTVSGAAGATAVTAVTAVTAAAATEATGANPNDHTNSQRVPAPPSASRDKKGNDQRRLALTRSLSKKLVKALSHVWVYEDDDIFEDLDDDDDFDNHIEASGEGDHIIMSRCNKNKKNEPSYNKNDRKKDEKDNDGDDSSSSSCASDAPFMLTRSQSKRLMRSISILFGDEGSVADESLVLFGESMSSALNAHTSHEDDTDIAALPGTVVGGGGGGLHNSIASDGYEKLMKSVLMSKDQEFHNSLNDWMGSLSDIFDKNKGKSASKRLDKKDKTTYTSTAAAVEMDQKLERLSGLSEYLRESLSCRKLLPTLQEGGRTGEAKTTSKKVFKRSHSFSALGSEELTPDSSEADYDDDEDYNHSYTYNNDHDDNDATSFHAQSPSKFDSTESCHSSSMHNLVLPSRVLSPENSPQAKLAIGSSTSVSNSHTCNSLIGSPGANDNDKDDRTSIRNAVAPIRLASPVKSPRRKLNIGRGSMKDSLGDCFSPALEN